MISEDFEMENGKKFSGKVAIVTGGSRGIGRAICEKLAALGADLAVVYAGNSQKAAEVCEICEREYGVKARAYRCDVSDFEAVKETVAAVKEEFGTVNILVNNAGITRDGLVARMKEEDFDDVLNTNLKGAFNMIRQCSGLFLRNKEGCIVNISSVSGIMGNAGQANYSASKAGLIGLTKSVAKELAGKQIRCNAVAPGFIDTDMTSGQGENPLVDMIPLKRMGKTQEVAEAVAFLVGAEYITGEVLRVDGGIAI
jgi:3-oxoacyl-[acyl-carrier protein] reductase